MLDFGYYNMDCMQGMKEFPDGYFELAIVDPPYGGAGSDFKRSDKSRFGGRFDNYRPTIEAARTGGKWASKFGSKIISWDDAPSFEYFEELFRVSKNQIIWGGNYFELPPTRCFLIWRKTNIPEKFTMAMCEYAWTSFNDNAKWLEITAIGQQDRFHPTQKPVALYKWILDNYAKPGDKILDTHVGSASSLIACEDFGFQYVGFEIDEEYYKLGQERLERNRAQITISDLINDWRFP